MLTRLLIVEDHAILRDGLRTILADYKEFEIVGEAEDGLEALKLCESSAPDLVLLDLTLPKLTGIEVLKKIKREWPGMAVLVLTMHRSKQFLQSALASGADGYCLKDTPLDELLRAMRTVRMGEKYFSREMLPFLENQSSSGNPAPSREEKSTVTLTDREKEILGLVARGFTNRQIAETLAISMRTVDNHCTNLRNKIGVNSKRALTAYAFRAGLVN